MVDALGNDLSALAAAVAQLLSDVQGTITHDAVRRYYSGRVEATSFEVADAIVGGRSAQALTLVRHAYATGSAKECRFKKISPGQPGPLRTPQRA